MTSATVNIEDNARLQALIQERRIRFALGFTRYMGWGMLPIAAVLLITWGFYPRYTQLAWIALLLAVIAIGMASYHLFYRLGRVRVGTALALGLFLTAGVTVALVPELELSALIGYILFIILSTTILDRRYSAWLTALVFAYLVANLLLGKLVASRWFEPLDGTLSLVGSLVCLAMIYLVVSLVIRNLVFEQEQFYQRSTLASWEVERRAAAEREQHERLQQANQEIEQRASTEREQREYLQNLIVQVRDVVASLNSASAEILAATTQQAAGSSEQAAAIAQTSTTIDEVRAIADQTAQRASGVAEVAQLTTDVAHAGQQAVDQTVAGVQEVKARVDIIAQNVLALSEQAQAIGQIITAVGEIATQSNMLALNAAVEAARAGEAGKGFAVVAGEVRTLAERSRAATAQVRELLSEIQKGVNTAVMATEEGIKGADAGLNLVGQAGEAIRRLGESVNQSAQASLQIAAAAGQQLTGMEQIATAMQNINQVTAQTVAGTFQTERATQNLNDLASQLRQMISQYHWQEVYHE